MSEKPQILREEEELPMVMEPVREPAPTQPKQITLETYCRRVASVVPPETLSVFHAMEMNKDRINGSFEEFDERLRAFQTAPLG